MNFGEFSVTSVILVVILLVLVGSPMSKGS